ncbi:MAG: Crp/Fnr family transcriptional regulator [Phenylobacterium sp.]|uniref:Crp/Fnr family transcriptional regulator n=1 Tax=Phenylobacterium sp. TaxID=1871053 RepID=UPI001A2B579F|nr:Crp/Fnr family transcriptional regulator [Phenylobacterium sp.]MBJ7408949.1 Crp/Fnr family transcriptional regulator [Phenylobacterium sp.]
MTNPFFRKLLRRDRSLTEAEARALDEAVSHRIEVDADVELVRQDEISHQSLLLEQGWACRYGALPDGRRQILALHVSGDFVDLQSFPLKRMDHTVATLSRCRIAVYPHENLRRLSETMPHLTRLLWMATLIDAAILRQWLLGAGQRSALERAAHLICELFTRLDVVGAAPHGVFNLPLTQAELGDALGVSQVHANRVVGELRSRGLVTWRDETVRILDWPGLQALAEFDPTYLMLESMDR